MVARIEKRESVQHAAKYYQHLDAKDDLYMDGQDRPGAIKGAGADRLNLANQDMDHAVFKSLLEGKNPTNGKALTKGGENRVPGWDITFSADKSVSVLWAMADEKTKANIYDAHTRAVDRAMQYAEKNLAFTRVGAGGKESERLKGLVWSRFDHQTSRELDMQIHSHAFLFNMGLRGNGQWGSLDSRQFYKAQDLMTKVYQAEMSRSMELMGLACGVHKNGKGFYLKGIPLDARKQFSQRRAQIEQAVKEFGYSTPEGYALAALRTRQSKQPFSRQDLLKTWHQRGNAIGFGPEQAKALLENARERGATVQLASDQLAADIKSLDPNFSLSRAAAPQLDLAKRAASRVNVSKIAKGLDEGIAMAGRSLLANVGRIGLPRQALNRTLKETHQRQDQTPQKGRGRAMERVRSADGDE